MVIYFDVIQDWRIYAAVIVCVIVATIVEYRNGRD